MVLVIVSTPRPREEVLVDLRLCAHLLAESGARLALEFTSYGGLLGLEDTIDLPLTLAHPRQPVAILDGRGRPWWWKANVAGLRRMMEAGGFTVDTGPVRYFMPFGPGASPHRFRPRALFDRGAREEALFALRGDPHAAFAGAPRAVGDQAAALSSASSAS